MVVLVLVIYLLLMLVVKQDIIYIMEVEIQNGHLDKKQVRIIVGYYLE